MGVVRKGHLRCTFDSSGSRQWPHLLLPWIKITPLFQSSFLAKHELGCIITLILFPARSKMFCTNDIHIFCQRNSCIIRWTLKIFMHYRWIFIYFCATIHALWVHKGCNLYCGKCGSWYWPRSCNWGGPSWVKSTSSFFQCFITMYGNTKVTPAVHGCHGNFPFY